MHSYDIDALYAAVAKNILIEKQRGSAIGGVNNLSAKGDGPENAIRDWIASIIGNRYRVTSGHIVRSDGRKSKQMDVIIVRDMATAIMYGGKEGEAELVRAECVAAVGEVKSSWYSHKDIIQGYQNMVMEVESLQEGLLVENRLRFGKICNETTIQEMHDPISGRKWHNKCYAFVIALGIGECNLKRLSSDLLQGGIAPRDASVLILDEQFGGAICVPARTKKNGENVCGMQCEVYRSADEGDVENTWVTLQDDRVENEIASGRMLNLFGADLQLHLSTWSYDFLDPRRYVKLSGALRHRHPHEKIGNNS